MLSAMDTSNATMVVNHYSEANASFTGIRDQCRTQSVRNICKCFKKQQKSINHENGEKPLLPIGHECPIGYGPRYTKQQFHGLIAQSGHFSISEDRFNTILDLSFNFYCFYYDVDAFTHLQPGKFIFAIIRFLRNYITTSEVTTFIRCLYDEIGMCMEDNDEVTLFDPNDLEAQSFFTDVKKCLQSCDVKGSLHNARSALNSWRDVTESEIVKKFHIILKSLLTCTLTKQLALDFVPERILEYSGIANFGDSICATSPAKMVQQLLDFIVTFLESGYEFMVTGDLRCFLTSDRAVRDFVSDWEKLEIELTGSVTNLQARPSYYLDRLDNLIARGNALLSSSNYMIRPLIKSAMDHRVRYLKQINVSCFRKPPFSVLLHGPPGIGKSSIIQTIGTLYQRVVSTMSLDGTMDGDPIYPDLPWDPKANTYTKNSYDDFWSGYRGASQWLVILDDLAREKAAQVERGMGITITELLTIVNNIGVTSNQAALEDKGAVPIIPKLVVATSNTKNLHAHHAGSCPEAILRRLPYVIEPHVKPEYWDFKRGRMKELAHRVEDAWTFTIETYVMFLSSGQTKGAYEKYCPDPTGERTECTMAELNAFLCQKILSHERSSESMMEGLKIDPQITLCKHGVLSNFNCPTCYIDSHPDDLTDTEEELETQGLKDIVYGAATICKRPTKVFLNKFIFEPSSKVYQRLRPMLGEDLYLDAPIFDVNWTPTTIQHIMEIAELLPTRIFDELLLFFMRDPRRRLIVYKAILNKYCARVPKNVYIAGAIIGQFMVGYGVGKLVNWLLIKSIDLGHYLIPPSPEALAKFNAYRYPDLAISQQDSTPMEPQANIWKSTISNDDFMAPYTTSKNNNSEIENTIYKSEYHLVVRQRGKTEGESVNGFQLIDDWQCTVGHAFPLDTGPWQCLASFGAKHGTMRPTQGFTVTEEDVRRLPNDIIIFRSSNLLPRRSLFKYLPRTVDKAGRKFRISDSKAGVYGHGMTSSYHKLSYPINGSLYEGIFMDGIRDDRSPVKGDCGSLVVSQSSKGCYISGMHVAGSPSAANPRIVITQLSQDTFRDYIGQEPVYLQAGDKYRYAAGSKRSGPLGPPHPSKGVHHWAESANGVVLGSYKGRVQPTTHVTKSIICEDIEKAFDAPNPFHKPVMTAIEEDGEWKNPFTIAAKQQGTLPCDFVQKDIDACADAYLVDLLKDSTWLRHVQPISLRDAVNGIHGVDYIDILNMGTSGGFYFPGAKKKYFEEFTDESGVIYYMPNDEVMEMMNDIETTYVLGDRYGILFNGTLKDEPVSLKKRLSGATRVFTACDVAFSIIVRRQYLSLTAAIQKANLLTECAVGMNVYSTQWDDLYKHVTKHGLDRIIAGDFETFDKRMAAIIIAVVFRVLDTLRSHITPLNHRDVMISKGIKTDIAFPVTNMNGDVIQFFGGNSSGHPLTIIVNSVANSIYMRFAYLKTGHELSTFKEHVSLMVMGDDNISGSELDGYNHTSIAEALRKVGIKYTMADKDEESRPFCNINEVDFCKRGFVLHGDRCIAPIASKSILKSLCMYVEKGNISHEEQLAQSYLAARREWSLHGRDQFAQNTARMSLILCKHPEVERFFIDKHGWPYQRTLDWTLGIQDEEDY